jgi:beta-phosphoglucomutase-like phosphatase (HAD superfamily)
MSLRALLWDLDGTLLDTEHLWLQAETDVMALHGYVWSESDQRHCLGGPIERVTRYMSECTVEGTPPHVLAAELLDAMEHYLRTHDHAWRPGAVALIQQARSAAMGLALVTASHRRLLDALDVTLEHNLAHALGGGSPVFSVTVAGDEVHATKPDPTPYLEAALRLGVDITECVVIEDSPTGVRSGLASGAFVIAVPHLNPIEPAPRCRVVTSLEDVDLDTLRAWHADN